MSMTLDLQAQADAAKALDMERMVEAVREAWRRAFPHPQPVVREPRAVEVDWPPSVATVRDDGVIAYDEKTGQNYLVAYHRQDDGQIAFAPRSDWKPVELSWAPVTKALDEADDASEPAEDPTETDRETPAETLTPSPAADPIPAEDDASTKAGARNSATDRQHIRDIRALARQIINATTTMEPTDDEDQYSELREAMAAVDMVVNVGGTEVKALGDGKLGGWMVLFGDPDNTDLSRYRDYFAPDTDYGLDEDGTGKSFVLYNHGLDPALGTRRLGTASLKKLELGIWGETQLAMRDEYERDLERLAMAGKLGWSTGTASHLVQREKQPNGSHKITQWWLGLDTSFTPRPAEPRTRVLPIKAWQEEAEPALKALSQADEQPADGAASAQDTPPAAIVNPNLETQTSEVKMNEEELKAFATQVAQQAADAATKAVLDQQAANEPPINGSPGFANGNANGAADAATKSFDALYVTRYGNEDDAMKAVMSDMFGNDYRQLVHDQNRAFGRFLRRGDSELDGNQRNTLRTQIFPPEIIKSMLINGYDVNAIKDTQREAQGTLGGYAVPPSVQSEIIRRLPGLTAVRGAGARVHTLEKTNSTEMPSYSGGTSQYVGALRGAWGNETATPAEKNFAMTLETVVAHIYTFKVPMSQSLVEDAANLVQLVTEDIATTMSIDEDNAFLTGNGVGKPLGLLPGGANAHSLTEVLSLAAATLTAAGIKKLKRGVATQYRKGAIWVGESDTFGIIETLESGTGSGYVFPDLSEDDMLLKGRVFESEAMPTVGAGTFPLLFGQMSGYWIVEKPGLTIVRFQDSNTGINKVEFHVRKRVGGRPVETWKFAVQKVAAS